MQCHFSAHTYGTGFCSLSGADTLGARKESWGSGHAYRSFSMPYMGEEHIYGAPRDDGALFMSSRFLNNSNASMPMGISLISWHAMLAT